MAPFYVTEHGLQFEVSVSSGYSQGIFLDQRENRQRVRAHVSPASRVLNTFSYTCAFSVAAAVGGAVTTSLDLHAPYLDWGKRNFAANGLNPKDHYFCRGDAETWMQRFAKQGRRFQGIILDPPTFSRAGKQVFRAGKDYHRLVTAAASICEEGGWMLCCCNEHRLELERFRENVMKGLKNARVQVHALEVLEMPGDFSNSSYLKSIWVTLR